MKKTPYTCGDCRFLCSEKAFDKTCDKLGMIETAKACTSFKPNLQKFSTLIEESENTLELLAQFMRRMPTNHLHILASVITNEKNTRKFGYYFMQRVYVRYRGTAEANYVNNFVPCHIMEASRNGLRLLSADGQIHIFKEDFKKGELAGPNIFSQVEFRKHKAAMVKASKLEDPAHKRKKINQSYLIEEEAPKTTKSVTYTTNDLVTMTQDVERGYIANSTYRKPRTEELENHSRNLTIGL